MESFYPADKVIERGGIEVNGEEVWPGLFGTQGEEFLTVSKDPAIASGRSSRGASQYWLPQPARRA